MNTEGFILTPPSYVREREPFSRFPSFPSLMKEHGIGGGVPQDAKEKAFIYAIERFLKSS